MLQDFLDKFPKEISIVTFRRCSTVDYFMFTRVCKKWEAFVYDAVLTNKEKGKPLKNSNQNYYFLEESYIKARDLCFSKFVPTWPKNSDKASIVKYMPFCVFKECYQRWKKNKEIIPYIKGLILAYRTKEELKTMIQDQDILTIKKTDIPWLFKNKDINTIKWILEQNKHIGRSNILKRVFVTKQHMFDNLVNLNLLAPTFAECVDLLYTSGNFYLDCLWNHFGKSTDASCFNSGISYKLHNSLWLIKRGFAIDYTHVNNIIPLIYKREESVLVSSELKYFRLIIENKLLSEEEFFKAFIRYIRFSTLYKTETLSYIKEVFYNKPPNTVQRMVKRNLDTIKAAIEINYDLTNKIMNRLIMVIEKYGNFGQ